jgi:hypothetical protein
MITHIVFMKFKDGSPEAAAKARDMLMALPAKIPQIRHYEVGLNVVQAARNYDLALVSTFATLDDLNIYGSHPDHQDALVYIRSVLESSAAVDYES